MSNLNIQQTNAQQFMHAKKNNVKKAQKHGSADGSKVPTSGGKQPRPQGKPGMSYAGGTPGFYDKGGPGAPGKVYENGELPQVGKPGGGNGAGPQPTPGPGARPAPYHGIPRGEVGSPFNGGQPPQFGGGGARPQPTPGPGGRPPRRGGGENTIGIPRGEVGGNPFDSNRPPQFGGGGGARPQPTPGPGGRPPRRGGGENTIGIPRGEVGGNPFDSNRPPQFGGRMPQFGGRMPQFGGQMNYTSNR